jgi:DNA-binding CsgD family transcriptional regulator
VPEHEAWLRRAKPDLDNFRAALGWGLDRDPAAALRLAGALDPVWYRYGHFAEGRRWLERALAADDEAPPAVRARAVCAAGWLASQETDLPRADALLAMAVARYRDLGDPGSLALALLRQGCVALSLGDLARSRELYEEARARALAAGDRARAATATDSLARVAALTGDAARAAALHEACVAERRQLGDRWGVACGLMFLGGVVLSRGDRRRALALYREALALLAELEDPATVARCLEGLAGAATAFGQPEAGARLLGAAAALRERNRPPGRSGGPPDVRADRGLGARGVGRGRLRRRLVRRPGRCRSIRAIAEALAVADAATASAPAAPAGLTPREREVLRFLAEGRTDREIAATLFISRRTASEHVGNILRKLGARSRADAATCAVRRGLA